MNAQFNPVVVSSWGRTSRNTYPLGRPRYRDEIQPLLRSRTDRSVLAIGLGRSYGDSGLNNCGCLVDMTALDRVIAFDPETGILRAESGLSLDAALRLIVPYGWFFATTPGSRFVTLGGAIANDVHGKNHHSAGTFGCSVRRMGLLRSDGSELELSRDSNGDLFAATIAGLGLTGIITWAEIVLVRIPSAFLQVERIPFGNIAQFFVLAAESVGSYEHTVAWIDCASTGGSLGRGIFTRGNWLGHTGLKEPMTAMKSMPVELPSWALNKFSVRAFNAFYLKMQQLGPPSRREHYRTFFYPLDAIANWNRMYGRRGFYQYQCVVPFNTAERAIDQMITQISRVGAGSFLAVLKTLGERTSPGLLSFPCSGATLALDFPNRGAATLELLARLDSVVSEAGGRLYPAKDGRMPGPMFKEGYASAFSSFVAQIDPAFSSDFWRRVAT